MAWPQATDYNEALQTPARCFRDPDLQQSEVAVDMLGLPRPRSGNFADVYQLHDAASGQSWAVKCFTREVHGLRERYRAISTQLAQSQLPFMVEFSYHDEGIRIRNQWFPVLKMRWVEGLTLNEFARAHADRPTLVEQLGGLWLRLAQQLHTAQIAHGDLQHGNVLLISGAKANSLKLRLIDYDGMYTAALADRPSGELGHPNYQHPERLRLGTYHVEMDRFAHLVIFTALRSLVVGGGALWERYDNGENLLFREKDFRDPGMSALFRELWHLDDDAGILAGHLLLAAQGPLSEVPLLEDVWLSSGARPLTVVQHERIEALLAHRAEELRLSAELAEDEIAIALTERDFLDNPAEQHKEDKEEEEDTGTTYALVDEPMPWWQSLAEEPLARPRPLPVAKPALYGPDERKPVAAPTVPGSILPNWGSQAPGLRYQGFWLPRRGRTAAQYRQAFASDIKKGRFALASGVHEGRWAGLWSRLLVDGFVAADAPPLADCAEWLGVLQQRWVKEVKARQTSYSFATALQQGVFASFIGVATGSNGNRSAKRWQAVVSGDCGLLLVRDRKLEVVYPPRRSDQVTHDIGWLGSRTKLDEELETAFLRSSGPWQDEDRLILTSGALLEWFQGQAEVDQKPWDALERLAGLPDSQHAFAAWIEWMRDHAGLANDDVTLLTVRL